MLLAVLAPLLVARMASATCESSIPSNIEAGMLQGTVVELLQRSVSFRQQCRRIGAVRALRVTLQVGSAIDEGVRAVTVINRYEAGGIRAEMTLRFSEDYMELLAHEFEHVIEQVDGVSLRDEVASGRAWRTPSGAFETRRAFAAGVRARQEWDALAAEVPGGPQVEPHEGRQTSNHKRERRPVLPAQR